MAETRRTMRDERQPVNDVALHAIGAFGPDTPEPVIACLIQKLISGDKRVAPAASEALRVIGGDQVVKNLIQAALERNDSADWILATLGRLPAKRVRAALHGDPLLARLEPLLLLTDTGNWMAGEDVGLDLQFLLKQHL